MVASGSIRFGLRGSATGGQNLASGDRLELPAGTLHDAVVGLDGVSCLEAHLVPGTFDAVVRCSAGSW